ncbi:LuxR C-terminal-related transcriptional regulator [Roseateles cellulosilyticus]|uniref:LuxR C-terminal-related transcriptional regulator n=1 Tax=Pelomonas cellulosilytica TaxID=2906762 RepID=A0ABS8XWY9_9BURK|nr:LuxR C-terminal-related transcriptional regulator [Pelomonas sp. P8]MCE4556463.1 LuxR C-terminal-related transcriptional regulator [Pelomonas sp. P8]
MHLAIPSSPMLPTPSELPVRPASMPPTPTQHVLAALPQPLLVLQPDRQLLFANASMQKLLDDGQGRLQGGRLVQLGPMDALRLGELLALAAAGTSSRTGLWFTPSLATGWLHVAPLAPAIALPSGWPISSVLCAVHLDQPALTQAARIDALTRQCRLSQAERQVLLLLADGEPVEATSRHLGLQVSTVRSHVRNLLGKTQAPTLMQLLRWTGSAAQRPH